MTKKEELKGMKESRSRELRCVRRECFGEKKSYCQQRRQKNIENTLLIKTFEDVFVIDLESNKNQERRKGTRCEAD